MEKPGDFSCGAFLFCVVDDCLSKCPDSKKTPLPKKVAGYASELIAGTLCFYYLPPLDYFYYNKTFMLKCS